MERVGGLKNRGVRRGEGSGSRGFTRESVLKGQGDERGDGGAHRARDCKPRLGGHNRGMTLRDKGGVGT